MPKALQTTLLTLRELLFTAGPFALLAAGLLWGAYHLLQPTPPRTVVLATGVAQGAYDSFGKRYAELLARHGITVQLRNTQGSAENLALLQQPGSGVDIAFVQGGTWQKPAGADADADPGLQSLGRMFHEPIWLFYRTDSARRLARAPQITRLAQLAGGTLNVGAPRQRRAAAAAGAAGSQPHRARRHRHPAAAHHAGGGRSAGRQDRRAGAGLGA